MHGECTGCGADWKLQTTLSDKGRVGLPGVRQPMLSPFLSEQAVRGRVMLARNSEPASSPVSSQQVVQQ